MDRIVVSTIGNPSDYPNKDPRSRAQLAYFVYTGLRQHFGERVVYVNGPADLSGNDILVAQLLNKNLETWKRSIVLSNDNFDTDKWEKNLFTKYGMNHKTLSHPAVDKQIKGCLSAIYTSNDPAIKRWNANDPQVLKKKKWLLNNVGNMIVTPHPIDKRFFNRLYDPNRTFEKPRMLVYHTDWLKYAKPLMVMLNKMGYKRGDDWDVVDGVDKTNETYIKKLLNRYTYLGHTSVSETGGPPYFAAEFLCQGMILYGHEEWWNGYGHPELCWTYDPKRQHHNMNSIKKIMSKEGLQLHKKYQKEVRGRFLDRKDNEWPYYMNLLINEIEKHI